MPNTTIPKNMTTDAYQACYEASIENPQEFWSEQANKFITWFTPWNTVLQGDFTSGNVRWFSSGKLNACYNCVDRHLPLYGNKTAIIWQGNQPDIIRKITYAELYQDVCKFANVLKKQGVVRGDRVTIYLPMIPEAVIAMLACARIGAIHSVVFAGFSAESLAARINNTQCSLLITADTCSRGEKTITLKDTCDLALLNCPDVKSVIVIQNSKQSIKWNQDQDYWYHDLMQNVDANCAPEPMDACDPLFILYTSGSTGAPKGVVHGTGGYLVYVATTYSTIFNCKPDEVYWCTADIGWITGHSYGVYGPLSQGSTILLFEGIPSYPNFARYWDIIDQHQVNILYTAPTVLRSLRKEGDTWLQASSRDSLRLLGSVGEPLNPDVWMWYKKIVGKDRCPVIDTWWQTETGGILICPLPGAQPELPGKVTSPFFGISPEILDEHSQQVTADTSANLVITSPWPGFMQTIYGDHQRFMQNYFAAFPGKYLTGDGASMDADGHYTITGRNDDVINVSGHRLGTGELENALLMHQAVSEAAVVGVPDDITGDALYAFISTKNNINHTEELKQELIKHVRTHIGSIANIKHIQWAEALPKTRSGKIMRRILRKIAHHRFNELGDLSTLADPTVVDNLIKNLIK